MLDKGDLDGFSVWKRILRAIEELQGSEPGARPVYPQLPTFEYRSPLLLRFCRLYPQEQTFKAVPPKDRS